MQVSDRDNFDRLCAQASFLLRTKRYKEAVTYAEKALAILPDNPRPYVQIAYAKAYLKNSDAPNWARKAIEKEPERAQWRVALADTFTIRNKWSDALEPLQEAVAIAPENSEYQSALGRCLNYLGKFKEAIPILQKALELNPQNVVAHQQISVALLKTGDKDGSKQHLKEALEIQPDNPSLQNLLGWQFVREGKRKEASKAFQEALRLNPQLAPAKLAVRAPPGRKVGLEDIVLRISLPVAIIPHYTIFCAVQVIILFGVYDALNTVQSLRGSWQLETLDAIAFIWFGYLVLAPRLVRIIGKRRSVHVY